MVNGLDEVATGCAPYKLGAPVCFSMCGESSNMCMLVLGDWQRHAGDT